ncbi:hypothetical protein GY14_08305 [Delftia tsuruhatensis]|uniref:hypothetical protein n=1 Tax=uncultured Delftia sp. TaxID=191464 RepID=UPI0004DAA497|nr:hypothetical protein [uncultured Delftia sp.]KEH10043.1 hypothetical protein GY14_08305 [Delftia tsuruhatensis]
MAKEGLSSHLSALEHDLQPAALAGSLTCARNSGARLAGPRRLQLWVAPHPSRRADILALEKWLMQEMGEMASTGDLAVP